MDLLTDEVFGHSTNVKDAIKKLFGQLGVDAPGLLALQGEDNEELVVLVRAEVDKLNCAPFIKAIIKSKLKQVFEAANKLHKSMLTPAHLQQQAAKSQRAWSNLVARLSAWATTSATSPDVAAHFTREALGAMKAILDSDGVTLRFTCPECDTSLRVSDSHSFNNIVMHMRQKHRDLFSEPTLSAEGNAPRKRKHGPARSESGASLHTLDLPHFLSDESSASQGAPQLEKNF